MIVVLDASTLINLANGGVLAIVLALPGVQFHVSVAVRRESKTIARAIDAAVADGALFLVDDTLVTATEFADAKAHMGLDDGETECILVAAKVGHTVATDDRAARVQAAATLGEARVTGSIGLLKRCCAAGLMTADEALAAHEQMLEQGGFLPAVELDYFLG